MRTTLIILGLLGAASAAAQTNGTNGTAPAPLPTIIEGPGAAAPPAVTPEAAYERGRREQREADAKRAAEAEGAQPNDGVLFDGGGQRERGRRGERDLGPGLTAPKQDGLDSSGLSPRPFPAATLTAPIMPDISRPSRPSIAPIRRPDRIPEIR